MKILAALIFPLALTLIQCSSPTQNPDNPSDKAKFSTELQETYWKLVELHGQPVINPNMNQQEAHILFKKENSRLQGSGGCNTLMGEYELLKGNRLHFTGVASTRMVCPDMKTEDELNQVLTLTDSYSINGKYLMLHKAKMAPLAKFEAQ